MLADEKTRDWFMLGAAIVMIEGPKVMAMRKARQPQPQPAPAPVTPTGDLSWRGLGIVS
jgi:hypothetical protein